MVNIQPVLIDNQAVNNNNNLTLADILAKANEIEMQKPVQERLSPEQLQSNIYNGLNMGNPDIANWQRQNNIAIPQNEEEIEKARLGLFNTSLTPQNINQNQFEIGVEKQPSEFNRGFNENYNKPFALSNLAPNSNKNWQTRLGEGLGSVVRFIDSPVGRGLLAAGLNSSLGYDNSLQEGLTAAVGRQNYMTADNLYRNQLKQYGFTNDDLNNIRGNITNDIYKNISSNLYKTQKLSQDTYTKLKTAYDRQLKSGSLSPQEYALRINELNKQYVNSNIATAEAGDVGLSNQTRNTNMNEELLPYKKYALQTAPQVALGNLGVNQGRLNEQIRQDNFNNSLKSENAQLEQQQGEDLAEFQSILNSRNSKQIQFARNEYIRRHGKDPMSLIQY